jgi:hypothetical protein
MVKKDLSCVLKMMEGVEEKILCDLSKAWALSDVKLPACASVEMEEKCSGCTKSSGLYLQCERKKVNGTAFCKGCIESFVEEGRPKNGLYKERLSVENWRSNEGKEPKSWMKYLQESGLSKEDGLEYLKSKGIESIPEKEWIVKKRGSRGRSVSDTSSEGEKGTPRFISLEGKRKSPPKDKAHKGNNGAMLRVMFYKESGRVSKVNVQNWTDEANKKFAEMYCDGEEDQNQGTEVVKKGKSKRSRKDDKLAEMTEMLAKLVAENESLKLDKNPESKDAGDLIEKTEAAKLVEKAEAAKLVEKAEAAKLIALKKAEAAKLIALKKAEKKSALLKKKLEDEKKRKKEAAAEVRRQQEALKLQIAALENEEFDDDEEGDGEIEFNEFEHNGTKYHRDEENSLYTDDGDFWGYVNDSNEVVEGDRD